MGEMMSIGVILNDDSKMGLNHTYFSEILESAKREFEKNNFSLLFLNNDRTRPGAKTYAEQLKEYNCAGCIIACPGSEEENEIDDVVNSGITVAAIDRKYPNCICVTSDNDNGMERLTDYVISKGHRRIAIILGDDNLVTRVRFNGFLRAAEKNHITIPEEYICRGKYRDMKQSLYHTEELLKLKNPPTCIMYSDDYAAIGGINVIGARGLILPRDLSITGYDGNEILAQYEPKLTTIKQDGAKMGEIAAQKMLEKINNPSADSFGEYIVDVTLEEGRTVKEIYDSVG